MRACEGWNCSRGAVWEAEEGKYYWYRYPWPVGREDLLVLHSHRLRKDNKIIIIIMCDRLYPMFRGSFEQWG